MEAASLVVSGVAVFRERARAVRPAEPGRKAGHRLKESAWIGHCALTEECEIMVCEQERQDTEAAVGATRAGKVGDEASVFPMKQCVSHGLGVAAKRKPRGSSGSAQT